MNEMLHRTSTLSGEKYENNVHTVFRHMMKDAFSHANLFTQRVALICIFGAGWFLSFAIGRVDILLSSGTYV